MKIHCNLRFYFTFIDYVVGLAVEVGYCMSILHSMSILQLVCHLSISISVFGMIIKIASFMFCSSLYYFVFLKNFAILMIFNVLR